MAVRHGEAFERASGSWLTDEAPRDAGRRLRETLGARRVALVDCLKLLVSNSILPLGESSEQNPRVTTFGECHDQSTARCILRRAATAAEHKPAIKISMSDEGSGAKTRLSAAKNTGVLMPK
jgi:adenosyl cobinamide kinase/adenosyl cobinamide phosphate guanylyltransferase